MIALKVSESEQKRGGVQGCAVHLMRATLRFASKAVGNYPALRPVYTAPTAGGEAWLAEPEHEWGEQIR